MLTNPQQQQKIDALTMQRGWYVWGRGLPCNSSTPNAPTCAPGGWCAQGKDKQSDRCMCVQVCLGTYTTMAASVGRRFGGSGACDYASEVDPLDFNILQDRVPLGASCRRDDECSPGICHPWPRSPGLWRNSSNVGWIAGKDIKRGADGRCLYEGEQAKVFNCSTRRLSLVS